MSLNSAIALFVAMIILAAIPDASALAVIARALASGFMHGFVTVIGIVAGDFVFILFAVYSLSAIADTMATLFIIIKYLSGIYLIWLGIGLWRSTATKTEIQGITEDSWLANFLCGLFITLGDPKAILFYISFLPAYIELSTATIFDIALIMMITTLAVGGVKVGYAYMAGRARLLLTNSRVKQAMNRVAGGVMVATGIFLMTKA